MPKKVNVLKSSIHAHVYGRKFFIIKNKINDY